ncbi:hypothetical protein CK203_046275 [Vitis vinifera]|uniref:Uncharacterized protein n=1 Tax=Vitis vinifera TaxID=29760 RepID=A0A438HDG7_VITVI|nr:hypothetical protein CK203_046275 [Vitis vinifera]
MGYIDVWEHSGGDRHIDADWSLIIEDLYSPELGNPLGCRGSACVDVMTTLHGNTSSFRSLDLPSWVRVERRLVRFSERSDIDQQVVTVDQFTIAMVSIQEALTSLRHEIGSQQSRQPIV